MDIDQFAAQITAAHQRMTDLHQQIAGAPVHRVALQVALTELDTSFKELRTAEETLREQNQELLVMHEALAAERQRYQELFEGAPDGYLVTTLAGTIQAANRAAGALLNLSPHFVIGLPLALFIADQDRQQFQEALSRLRRTGQLANWEVCLQPRNQPPIDVEISVSAERDAHDHIVVLRWLLRDVRARKQAAAEVAALNAELEQRVQQRTAQLEAANQALARANAAAEAALQDREAFLAIAAHELKSPLATLFGSVFMLEHSVGKELQANPLAQHALRVLQRDMTRLNSLIDQLLDLAWLQTAQFEMHRQPLNLVELAAGVVEDVQPTLDQHTIDLQLPRTPMMIEGDVLRLEQALRNLLQNAIKYSPNGGTIIVRLEQHSDQVMLSVIDHGIGIPAAAQPHIFERFYRAGNGQTHGCKGLGIGLYIVQQIVMHHGGTIEVVSQEGDGSTFTLHLPRLRGDTHATKQMEDNPA